MFDGILTVTDAEALIQEMMQGIGPAKAFGCGLLSIARA
jgi:CRISPR system Cascade subunit CasE